jgi:hypothetical protein
MTQTSALRPLYDGIKVEIKLLSQKDVYNRLRDVVEN